jgi:hypothetical protein
MTTLRQVHANQRNAQKSTGPRTDEGKERSRANALKDGLTGAGVVLTVPQQTRVDERIRAWRADVEPAGVQGEEALKQLAVSLVRMEQCQVEEDEHTADLARRAAECWDDDRRLDAERLGARLSSKPALISRQLVVTAAGCLWLLDRWTMLRRALRPGDDGQPRPWTEAQEGLALDLLGIDPVLRIKGTRPWVMADVESATALVEREIARLERRAAGLARLDERERLAALQGIPVGAATESGPGRAIGRLRRLDAAAFRKFLWAIKQLRDNAPTPEADAPKPAPAPASPQVTPRVEKRTHRDTGSSLPPLPIMPSSASRPAGPIVARGNFLPISVGAGPGR